MLETAMPYLMRPLTDQEARLGLGMIDHLQRLGGEGLTDQQAEVAMMCMLAIYAQHRMALGDMQAPRRIYEGAAEIVRSGRFAMRRGDDFARMVKGEIESGRLTLNDQPESIE